MMHDAKNLTVAYIGGGSRGWAWGFMTDLAADPDLCGTLRRYDIDREAAERNGEALVEEAEDAEDPEDAGTEE